VRIARLEFLHHSGRPGTGASLPLCPRGVGHALLCGRAARRGIVIDVISNITRHSSNSRDITSVRSCRLQPTEEVPPLLAGVPESRRLLSLRQVARRANQEAFKRCRGGLAQIPTPCEPPSPAFLPPLLPPLPPRGGRPPALPRPGTPTGCPPAGPGCPPAGPGCPPAGPGCPPAGPGCPPAGPGCPPAGPGCPLAGRRSALTSRRGWGRASRAPTPRFRRAREPSTQRRTAPPHRAPRPQLLYVRDGRAGGHVPRAPTASSAAGVPP